MDLVTGDSIFHLNNDNGPISSFIVIWSMFVTLSPKWKILSYNFFSFVKCEKVLRVEIHFSPRELELSSENWAKSSFALRLHLKRLTNGVDVEMVEKVSFFFSANSQTWLIWFYDTPDDIIEKKSFQPLRFVILGASGKVSYFISLFSHSYS